MDNLATRLLDAARGIVASLLQALADGHLTPDEARALHADAMDALREIATSDEAVSWVEERIGDLASFIAAALDRDPARMRQRAADLGNAVGMMALDDPRRERWTRRSVRLGERADRVEARQATHLPAGPQRDILSLADFLSIQPDLALLVADVRRALRRSSPGGRAITPEEATQIGERLIGIVRKLLS